MKINKLTPNFEVKSIQQTVDFYTEYLGFNLIMAVPETQDGIEQTLTPGKEYVYAMMQKDHVELFFQQSDSFKQDLVFSTGLTIGASVSFYMEVEGIEDLYLSLKSKNFNLTELKTTWYGMQEFYMQDINGYILGFAQKVD